MGETWEGVPYEPLVKVAPGLHKDELFHCTLGMRNLKHLCATARGLAEANELIHKWWPAALADLRRRYVAETRPMLEDLGIIVPDDRLDRRFL